MIHNQLYFLWCLTYTRQYTLGYLCVLESILCIEHAVKNYTKINRNFLFAMLYPIVFLFLKLTFR